jgi:hypothetical protein
MDCTASEMQQIAKHLSTEAFRVTPNLLVHHARKSFRSLQQAQTAALCQRQGKSKKYNNASMIAGTLKMQHCLSQQK